MKHRKTGPICQHSAVVSDQLGIELRQRVGIEPALAAQFGPLESSLEAMGVAVWPMVELEADDGLASAARIAAADPRLDRGCIWTPANVQSQCVVGERVVQVDRRGGAVRDEAAVRAKFGVPPALIPDWLALVGDSADGYPGIPGIGPRTAADLLNRLGPIEDFPPDVLGERLEAALLFKRLATLRTDAPLFEDVEELRWAGPTEAFEALGREIGGDRLVERARKAERAQARASGTQR